MKRRILGQQTVSRLSVETSPQWMLITITAAFASVILAQQLPKAAVVMNVSVNTDSVGGGVAKEDLVWDNKTHAWAARDMYVVHYEMAATSKRISIRPQMRYLSLLTDATAIYARAIYRYLLV